jgi:hypothetical protein
MHAIAILISDVEIFIFVSSRLTMTNHTVLVKHFALDEIR